MKVLQINKHAWPHYGGIEKVVQNIADLVPGEVESDVLCIAEAGQSNLVAQRGRIFRAKPGIKLLSMPISWDFFKLAHRLLPEYDAVILHHPFPLGFLVYWLFGKNKPMVVWYHSDVVRQRLTGFLIQPLFRAILSRAKIIVVSHRSVAENSPLVKHYLNKIVEIPYFADSLPLQASANQQVHILSVGRLVYYKGYQYLLEAMRGIPAKLTIIGNGPLLEELLDQIQQLQLENVQIVDPVPDLTGYYQQCDIFVLPSVEKSEAFGIVQIEAMAAGKPVINTNLPTAVPTVSLHGESGLTVPPKDVVALREAISTLVADPELRERYSQGAREAAQNRYSPEIFQRNIALLIDRLR